MKPGEMFLRREPEKFLAVAYGWVLRGLSFKKLDEGWRMTITVRNDKNKHVVGFIHASTVYDCWSYFYEDLTKTSRPVVWRTDKYYGK